jgi:hypothetical protein
LGVGGAFWGEIISRQGFSGWKSQPNRVFGAEKLSLFTKKVAKTCIGYKKIAVSL